jgi:hypothetical protein
LGNQLAPIGPETIVRKIAADIRTGETLVPKVTLNAHVLTIAAFGRQLASQVLVSIAATTCVGLVTGAKVEVPLPEFRLHTVHQLATTTLPPTYDAASGKIIDRLASEPNWRVGQALTVLASPRPRRFGDEETAPVVAAPGESPGTLRLPTALTRGEPQRRSVHAQAAEMRQLEL